MGGKGTYIAKIYILLPDITFFYGIFKVAYNPVVILRLWKHHEPDLRLS